MTNAGGPAVERERQQWLLARLRAGGADAADADWLKPGHRDRGLSAYAVNAAAAAERALAATYPTVQAMLGDGPFADQARRLWAAQPPVCGDLAEWGLTLPDVLAADPALQDWPYLADCARLDRAVACSAQAADGEPQRASLSMLGDTDPDRIALVLAPSVAVVRSPHPIATLWHAHQPDVGDAAAAMASAREALAEGRGECARVWREGWQVRVASIAEAEAVFTEALQRGRSLGAALAEAGDGLVFEAWLVGGLQQGWLLGAARR